eukprot:366404-Chlamydomonas_euryale.AAC.2
MQRHRRLWAPPVWQLRMWAARPSPTSTTEQRGTSTTVQRGTRVGIVSGGGTPRDGTHTTSQALHSCVCFISLLRSSGCPCRGTHHMLDAKL